MSQTQIKDSLMTKEFSGNTKNVVLLAEKSPSQIVVCYDSEWKGVPIFSIREAYLDMNGEWAPGKGIQVLATKKKELLANLTKLPDSA